MAIILYNFAIRCFKLVLWLVAPFHQKAKKMIQGRDQWQSKLEDDFAELEHPVVWFHCASLGEFEQGVPVIEAFRREYPQHKILITFFSPSGYEVRKNYQQAHAVHYLPWDSPGNAVTFYRLVKPVAVFIVKYEFWYHLINEGRNRSIPVMVYSSKFNSNQVFFKSYGGLFRKMLAKLEHLFVQDPDSLELLKSINITSTTVAGDTRIDRVAEIKKNCQKNSQVEQFLKGEKAFIVGSSWPQDISLLAPLVNSETHLKFIIAPHEITDHHLKQIDSRINRPRIRYSEWQASSDARVMVIDTIGVLSHIYQYGRYAYIGGAFGKGLHNTLEAATFGLPLFFGNRSYQKFSEAVSLAKLGGAFPVGNSTQLLKTFHKLEADAQLYQNTSKICERFVAENQGATKIIMDHVRNIIKP